MLKQLDDLMASIYETAEVAGQTGHYFISDRLDDALSEVWFAVYEVAEHQGEFH
jgi:hypothetical protein